MTTPQVGPLPAWTRTPPSTADRRTVARVLDDENPIHIDGAAAAAAGLGSQAINQGPANLGYVVEMLHAALPDARLRRISTTFHRPVLEHDTITVQGRVDNVTRDPDGTTVVHCVAWLVVNDGSSAASAVAELVVAPQPG